MLKRIQESFSLKIFFITWAVLIFSNLLVLVGVYAFMPQIYTISYNESIHACMEEMEENLPRIRREESGDFFNELCEKYQIKLDIYDTYTCKRPEIPGLTKIISVRYRKVIVLHRKEQSSASTAMVRTMNVL